MNYLNFFLLILCLACVHVSSATSNFDWCCEIGRRNSENSRSCSDFSSLNSYFPTKSCKYAFSICCNQANRNQECFRGKNAAFEQEACFDATQSPQCDSFLV